jgi:hypothetical protein
LAVVRRYRARAEAGRRDRSQQNDAVKQPHREAASAQWRCCGGAVEQAASTSAAVGVAPSEQARASRLVQTRRNGRRGWSEERFCWPP